MIKWRDENGVSAPAIEFSNVADLLQMFLYSDEYDPWAVDENE